LLHNADALQVIEHIQFQQLRYVDTICVPTPIATLSILRRRRRHGWRLLIGPALCATSRHALTASCKELV
jgi:hypothetical protein